jgi:hypothetical protein
MLLNKNKYILLQIDTHQGTSEAPDLLADLHVINKYH